MRPESKKPVSAEAETSKGYKPVVPYPKRLTASQKNKYHTEIQEIFKQIKINIPLINILLLDAIQQVLSYAKFLNDLCTMKRKLNVKKKAFLTEQVSALILSETPQKFRDLGSPNISIMIVLRKHRGAIGWTIADIKDNARPVYDAQYRLNPTMKEVVKDEVLKLVAVGIIYPISDSKWHRAIWVIKHVNMSLDEVSRLRKLQINELDEACRDVYDNTQLAKERLKILHDQKIHPKHFTLGQEVLLYNSCLHIFPGKLKSCWSGLYVITKIHSHGAVEVQNPMSGTSFTING
ncbi:hypothetical protein F2P56_032943 [Juglans regia]|uniref:Uncharacterized protein n=2 Tax=Juglans regia TaxID=51240 RepID=A0A833TZP9_JUGRE|nr:uncharacterized protein LOC109014038 [Juglans regia]KAF5447388.1 hypothetical protein F2P56_032943 [Juglans regia]